jgi:hypothetical protein
VPPLRRPWKLGVWERLTASWIPGSPTSGSLELVNANTMPASNDFAVDDIYLGIVSTVQPPN